MIIIRNVKRLLVIIRFVDQLNLRSLSFHTVDYVDGSALTCYGSSCLRCGNRQHHTHHWSSFLLSLLLPPLWWFSSLLQSSITIDVHAQLPTTKLSSDSPVMSTPGIYLSLRPSPLLSFPLSPSLSSSDYPLTPTLGREPSTRSKAGNFTQALSQGDHIIILVLLHIISTIMIVIFVFAIQLLLSTNV